MVYEIGTPRLRQSFDCLDCAERVYNKLNGLKYLKDIYKNKIILNTYGWKNGK